MKIKIKALHIILQKRSTLRNKNNNEHKKKIINKITKYMFIKITKSKNKTL